ncbi:MAG: SGNH/GDSL hydrolase family protein [Rudaea sp.]
MWRSLGLLGMSLATSAGAAQPHFLALGDSYTIGESVPASARWPVQVVDALAVRGIKLSGPEIVAQTGWTTDELSAAMDAHTFHPPYALVTLSIGVNNQYRGRNLGNYRNEFQHLLERAIKLAGDHPQHVIVVSIPDWGVTRFGAGSGRDTKQIARELDAYNAANAKISARLGARYVDVTGISRNAGAAADMLTGDGLHPSVAQYKLWVDAILAQAQSVLSTR